MGRGRFSCATALLLLLAGCYGSGLKPPSTSPLLSLTATQNIGASGGSMSLGDGSAMTLLPGMLASTQAITVTRAPSAVAAAPNPAWQPEPGELTMTFASVFPTQPAPSAGATPTPAVTFTLPYAKADAAAILAARAPVVVITYADGSTSKISPDGTFDTAANTVTVTVPREALNGATSAQLYLAVDGVSATPSFGPRYWNGTAWQATPIALDPTKKTLVFVHGIFSSVETAFPCAGTIMAAGGYQQGVGLDYDWTQPPYTEAPILAAFVNGLNVPSVDFEAHSYGTVVTTATLPSVTKQIKNVVLLGGPLPLNGSPQADPGYVRTLLINLAEYVEPPSLVERAVNSGMVDSMATNSTTMQSIAKGTLGMANPPNYIEVSGRKPLPFEETTGVHFLYETLFGFWSNDGVVEERSAESHDFAHTIAIAGSFPDDHLQLECDDPSIISFVASYLK